MKPDQALQTLYGAARLAPLNAEQHELVARAAQVINEAIKPKDEKKREK